jgi:rod shape-determining protein MreD
VNSANGLLVIVLTLVVALWLSIVPLPPWAQWGRPEFVAMVVLYWMMAMPERIGIGSAWLLGLVQDIVEGSVLGEHALALAVLAYLVLNLYQRMRMFTPLQQAAVIFVFIGMHQLLCHWVQALAGASSSSLLLLMPALISALLWPLLALLLRLLRRSYFVR